MKSPKFLAILKNRCTFLTIFITSFLVFTAFSQSKKEQIELLTHRVDSLNSLLVFEKNSNIQNEKELSKIQYSLSLTKQQLGILNNQVDSLHGLLDSERYSNAQSEKKLSSLNSLLINCKDELAKKEIELRTSTQELKNKSTEILDLKNHEQSIIKDLFYFKVIGVYNLPSPYGTCLPEYKLYIDRNLLIKFKTSCLRPVSSNTSIVGTFELDRPIKFEGIYISGFLFKEDGFYLLDEDFNYINISECCNEQTEKECDCFISYSSKIIE